MDFHVKGIKYSTIPDIRWGIVASRCFSNRVLIPNKNSYRPLGINSHRYKVYKEYYDTFEKSLKKEGIRNPILCWAFKDDDTYVVYGTTRLWLAQKHSLNIPAFIVDWSKTWRHLEKITSREQALSKFTDPPQELVFEEDYFNFYNEPNHYDPVYRKMRHQYEDAPTRISSSDKEEEHEKSSVFNT